MLATVHSHFEMKYLMLLSLKKPHIKNSCIFHIFHLVRIFKFRLVGEIDKNYPSLTLIRIGGSTFGNIQS